MVILDIDINTLVGTDVNLIKNLESDFWQYSADKIQKNKNTIRHSLQMNNYQDINFLVKN